MSAKETFAKEADLCAAFIECLPDSWTAYPETGGFDILLVRKADGMQIGVEAKLRLNAKVVTQAAESLSTYRVAHPSPDCRAVLVPAGVSSDLAGVCQLLGITVISMRALVRNDRGEVVWYGKDRTMARLASGGYSYPFQPRLPEAKSITADDDWHERCPVARLKLPDWVPDVVAGDTAPVALTPWKVGAIKLVVTLQRRGYLTRQDFAHFKISMSRWTQQRWLVKDGQGGWIAGPYMPDFKAQHPVNFDQIAADFEKWQPPVAAATKGVVVGELFPASETGKAA
ncbi:hypothetical protein PRN20_18170 [Devosia sp. ZB163]|uniref:hypothetical protein n=1 Tax=Devosia sp. ZB163 TaxID=3025938 RepID=UPI00235F3775|nr:hypothetical protein [Devosia sp. ZB163]MDC9825664.1 hypothetical protein [Devosia sp. ZB163]